MSAVNFDPKYRRTWMFPRNKRKIYPWWLSQTCKILSLQMNEALWSGNQQFQDKFCELLENAKLKRDGDQYSSNSGGARTYLSQLKCLGLIFEKNDKSVCFTRAGEQLISGTDTLIILQKLLLRLQYPSPYSISNNVSIHPDIKIKPFQLLLQLLSKETGLNYLSPDELIIPIVYGYNQESLSICKNKILDMRQGAQILDVINNIEDVLTPKGKNRNIEEALVDIKNIANTAKNYLLSARLITERLDNGKNIFEIDPDSVPLIEDEIKNSTFLLDYHNEEAFQRRFGCIDRKKDTRNLVKNQNKTEALELIKEMIQLSFINICYQNAIDTIPEYFIEETKVLYNVNRGDVTEAIAPILERSLPYFEEKFISLSRGEGNPNDFEKAVQSIFKNNLLFESINTSKRKRPYGVGGCSDILVLDLSGQYCGIIDTKASPKYNITSDDFHKMIHNYIKNYKELPEATSKKLQFCLYVAGGFIPTNIKNKLDEFSKTTPIPISAISARTLLAICKNKITQDHQSKIIKTFQKGTLLEIEDFDFLISNPEK